MNSEELSERVAYRIVAHRVSIPTWVVLYINVLISVLVANSVYLQDTLLFEHLSPFGGRVWSLLLMGASLVTLHGLLWNCSRTVSVGSIMGYMAWAMALISWIVIARGQGYYGIPLLTLPMVAFFMFVHLKHSIIQKWKDRVEKEEF